tara:strand:+ start:620 stop:760 length:141 start_codon:yes stop_codon:yes gene_type:complete
MIQVFEVVLILLSTVATVLIAGTILLEGFDFFQRRAYKNKKKWDSK